MVERSELSGFDKSANYELLRHGPARGLVLVVDDDESVRRITVAFLKSAGFDIQMAGNGDEALAALASGLIFDALVTDYAMVGMNGGDLILQARELYPTLPAMVVTAYPGAEGLDKLPPDVPVMHKPFARLELVRAVNELIANVIYS